MTGEEWKIVEEDLKIIGNPVKLTIDNYDITLSLGQISTYKNGIFIYINGYIKGIWLANECEERKRFLQKHEHNLYDIETTGTDINSDEVLQISIINDKGDTLLNSYVRPEKHTEWKNAEMIHGISPEKVKTSPVISELKNQIQEIVDNAELIVGYNLDTFDVPFLEESAGINFKDKETYDVMLAFAPIYGDYNERYGNYKWKSLSICADYYGYEFNAHDSLEDVKATLYCYEKVKDYYENIEEVEKQEISIKL